MAPLDGCTFMYRMGIFFGVTKFQIVIKDKDKEALFNVAYNVTDNISS